MQMYEYELEAAKTKQETADLMYLLTKLVIEATETLQILVKNKYHNKPMVIGEVHEELGDCLWYLTMACRETGASLESVANANIIKLRRRHGETYNPAHYAK